MIRRDRPARNRPGPPRRWALTALILAAVFGSSFALLTPPSRVADEPAHFRRAYAISEGQLMARRRAEGIGNEIPRSVVDLSHDFLVGSPFRSGPSGSTVAVRDALQRPLEPFDRKFIAYPNTALYGVVSYAPQAVALAVGRVFTDSVLLLFYLGRLASVAAAAFLLALTLRVAPFHRPVFFLLGLLPMSVFQTGSFSADAVTNGLAFLLTAYTLRCAYGERPRVRASDWAILSGLSILLALAKPGYVLLSTIVFLIPKARCESAGRKLAGASAVLLAAFGTTALWAAAVSSRSLAEVPGPGPAAALLADPIGLPALMLWDHVLALPRSAVQFVGVLGWADVPLPLPVVVAQGLLVLWAALTSGGPGRMLRFQQKMLLAAIVLGTLLLVTLPFYAPLIAPGPEGSSGHRPQGRYLLPVGPVAFLLLENARWRVDWDRRIGVLAAWVACVLAIALYRVVARFYL